MVNDIKKRLDTLETYNKYNRTKKRSSTPQKTSEQAYIDYYSSLNKPEPVAADTISDIGAELEIAANTVGAVSRPGDERQYNFERLNPTEQEKELIKIRDQLMEPARIERELMGAGVGYNPSYVQRAQSEEDLLSAYQDMMAKRNPNSPYASASFLPVDPTRQNVGGYIGDNLLGGAVGSVEGFRNFWIDAAADEVRNDQFGLNNARDQIALGLETGGAVTPLLNIDPATEAERLATEQELFNKRRTDNTDFIQERIATYNANPNSLVGIAGSTAAGVGGMLPAIGANLVIPGSGSVVLFSSAAGNATSEALKNGADYDEAFTYGVVSGATELATEKILGGIPGLSKGWFDNILNKNIARLSTSPLGKYLVKMGADALGEGFEEWLSEAIGQYTVRIYDEEERGRSVGEVRREGRADRLYAALIGTLTSLALQAPTISQGRVDRYNAEIGAQKFADDLKNALVGEGMTAQEAEQAAAALIEQAQTEIATATAQQVAQPEAQPTIDILPQETPQTAAQAVSGESAPTRQVGDVIVSAETGEVIAENVSGDFDGVTNQPTAVPTAQQIEDEIVSEVTGEPVPSERMVNVDGVQVERADVDFKPTEAVAAVKRFGKTLGADVVVTKSLPNKANGIYQNGVIYISETAQNPMFVVFKHELTHRLRGAKSYDRFENYILNQLRAEKGAGYDTHVQDVANRYGNLVMNADGTLNQSALNEELVAEYVERRLFNDQNAVNDLVRQHESVAYRIWTMLRDTVRHFTGNLTQEQYALKNAERMFARALAQTESSATVADAKNSLPDIRQDLDALSKEDREIVANARIRAETARGLATMTDARLEQVFSDYTYRNSTTTKGYLAYINPLDFLDLTTSDVSTFLERNTNGLNEGVSEDWGTENNIQESGKLYLRIDEDGNVVGHEGRHRMAALYRAGVEKAAVAIETPPIKDAKPERVRKLRGQFNSAEVYLHNMLPVTEQYARINRYIFGEVSEKNYFADSNIRYSLSDSEYMDSVHMDAVNRGDMETAQRMPNGEPVTAPDIDLDRALLQSESRATRDIVYNDEFAQSRPNRNISQTLTNTLTNTPIFTQAERDVARITPENADFEYDVVSERESLNRAAERVQADAATEQAELLQSDFFTGEDIDTAMLLAGTLAEEARQTDDWSQVLDMANKVQDMSTQNAQALQALAKWSRTPAGMLTETERLIEKRAKDWAENNQKKAANLDNAAKELAQIRKNKGKEYDFTKDIESVFAQNNLVTTEEAVSAINRKLQEGERTTNIAKGLKRVAANGFYDLTAEEAQQMMNLFEQSKKFGENSRERFKLESDAYKIVADKIGSTWFDKWEAWRYLAMLGNTRTHIRNMLGNSAFGLLVDAKNLMGVGVESAVDYFNRMQGGDGIQRTKAVVNRKTDADLLAATKADAEEQYKLLTNNTKYDARTGIEAQRKIFDFAPLESAREFNSRALDNEDWWAISNNYAKYLASYLKANNLSADILKEPNSKTAAAARSYAIAEAQKSVFRNANAFAVAMTQLSNRLKNSDSVYGRIGYGVFEGVLPFKNTPANIVARGIEYSPIGLLNAVLTGKSQLDSGTLTTEELIDKVSAGLTGTGIMLLGAFLSSLGLLRVRTDEDRDDLQAAQGHQDFALEIGGKSYTIDWLAPAALPLFVGAAIEQAAEDSSEDGFINSFATAAVQIMEPVTEMTMLQGLNDMLESIAYDQNNALSSIATTAATSYITQGVPTLFGQVARAIDDTRRSTYTGKTGTANDIARTLNRMANKVPGLSFTNQPYVDVWGRQEEQEGGNFIGRLAYNMLSPGFYSDINRTPVDDLVDALYEQTGDKGVIPSYATQRLTYDGTQRKLSPEEYTEYATVKGQTSFDYIAEIMEEEAFKAMSSQEQADTVDLLYDLANERAKRSVGADTKDTKWIQAALDLEDGGVMSVPEFLLAKSAADADGNGNIKHEEATEYIDAALRDLVRPEKAEVWRALTSATSDKNNPYA